MLLYHYHKILAEKMVVFYKLLKKHLSFLDKNDKCNPDGRYQCVNRIIKWWMSLVAIL